MSGRPGRGAALHDSATVREFRSKLMRVPGLTVCGGRAGSEAAVIAGHAHRGTGGAPSSSGRCHAVTPKVEFRGLGHRCENPLCQCVGPGEGVVIGRDIRGTAQVVNESGSAVLAANLEMTCLGSPATLGGRRPDEP